MRPLRVSRFLACAVGVLCTCSCALVMSFDHDRGSGEEVKLFALRGTIDGLDDDAMVAITVNGSEPHEFGNGAFDIPALVPNGLSFQVSATSPKEACSVNPASGVVAGVDVEVSVHCVSNNADLADLRVAETAIAPSFTADRLDYTATFPGYAKLDALVANVTATTASRTARVSLQGEPVVSGQSRSIAIDDAFAKPVVIDVAVTAASGLMRRYATRVSAFTYFKAPVAHPQGQFGGAVALTEDTLVVAEAGAGPGGVTVFRRHDRAWTKEASLAPTTAGSGLLFGYALSIDGDTLAVSAPDPVDGDGAVYIFERTGSTWALVTRIAGAPRTYFGSAVVLRGSTLVIGAYTESLTAGAVYVFTRVGSTWMQSARLTPLHARPGNYFGGALALDGDTLAVGAIGESSGASGIGDDQDDATVSAAGAVFLFQRGGSVWTQTTYVKASNPTRQAYFGTSLILSGDDLLVGAVGAGSTIYTLRRTSGVWGHTARLSSASTLTTTQFGRSMALLGDVLAVGAPGEATSGTGLRGNPSDTSEPSAGAVYLFRRDGVGWTRTTYLKSPYTRSNSEFGWALMLSAETLVVGARTEPSSATGINGDPTDTGLSGSGAVFAY